MPRGVRRITTAFRAIYLNQLLAACATAGGLAAYNVQVQIGYLTNALFMSIAQTLSLLLCIYYPEENKKGVWHTVALALGYELLFGALFMIVLWIPSVKTSISWFYLGENRESYEMAETAVHFFALGILGQVLSVTFSNYLQAIGRTMLSNVVYVVSDVVLVVVFVTIGRSGISPVSPDEVYAGATFAGVSYAQLCMLAVIPLMIMLVNLLRKDRAKHLLDRALLFSDRYGASEGDELSCMPRSVEEVNGFSRKAYDFCLKHGTGERNAYFISLAVEEMGNNVIKHGFTDAGFHSMELFLVRRGRSIFLRVRDNSHIFDPIKKMAEISAIEDPSRYIGLKMVMKTASEVTYTPTLKLNNLLIRFDVNKTGGKAPA